MTIDETEIKQNEFAEELDKSKAYPAGGSKYIELKESVPKNTKSFCGQWKKIIFGLKNWILPFSGMKTDSGDQQLDTLDTPEERRFVDILQQIAEK